MQKRVRTAVLGNRSFWLYHGLLSILLAFLWGSQGGSFEFYSRFLHLASAYPAHLLINLTVYLCFSVLLGIVLHPRLLHFFVCVLFVTTLATASRIKLQSTGVPLLWADLSLVSHLKQVISFATLGHLLLLCTVLVGALASPFLLRKILPVSLWQKVRRRNLSWPGLLGVGFVLLGAWASTIFLFQGEFKKGGIWLRIQRGRPGLTAEINGDAVAFLQSRFNNQNYLRHYQNFKPTFVASSQDESDASDLCRSAQAPDVYVFMVESLFDPVQIPGVHFSRDPLEELRSFASSGKDSTIRESQTYLYVPVYGGGTANTEFEFLTGASHRFFPVGSVQYQHHLYQESNSVVWQLRKLGYTAHAIHNNTRSFWRRSEVYPLLGFNRFIGLEDMDAFSPSFYSTVKARDDVLENVADSFLTKESASPQLNFFVTMGMHAGYAVNYHEDSDLEATLPPEFSSTEVLLENYSRLLDDTSTVLSRILKKVLFRDRPSVVIYFGDHLPPLPDHLLENVGYLDFLEEELDLENGANKMVPVHVLNNFSCDVELPRSLATNCLVSKLFPQWGQGFDNDEYWKFNRDFCERSPLIPEGLDPLNLTPLFKDYAAFMYQNIFQWKADLNQD